MVNYSKHLGYKSVHHFLVKRVEGDAEDEEVREGVKEKEEEEEEREEEESRKRSSVESGED